MGIVTYNLQALHTIYNNTFTVQNPTRGTKNDPLSPSS